MSAGFKTHHEFCHIELWGSYFPTSCILDFTFSSVHNIIGVWMNCDGFGWGRMRILSIKWAGIDITYFMSSFSNNFSLLYLSHEALLFTYCIDVLLKVMREIKTGW